MSKNNPIDFLHIPSITEDELVKDTDAILERVNHGVSPILVVSNTGSNLLLFAWNDYWNRFASLYPEGEKDRVEEACRKQNFQ